MKAFGSACILIAVLVVAIVVAFPFRESGPQVSSQVASQENSIARTAESAVGNAAENAIENAAGDAPHRPADKVAPENPQQQMNEQAAQEQPPASEQQRVATAADGAIEDTYPDSMPLKPDLSYLAYYVYSEVPPDTKPADTILQAVKEIPEGAPIDEIQLAATVLGMDIGFMKAVARIESGFDPKQRTGSYIGLFQLSHYEFDKYGAGEITDSRDNSVAAVYKFITAAILFEINTHKKPTLSDLYLIHQQGTQGAEEHVSHPERIAWKSMCATDEGRVKGEKWCKRAIWQNTLPAIKQIWKSVDNLTSGAFVEMWQQRVDLFYAHYSQALAQK
jgi:hypothetical protein